jgi:hypothetical protein
MIRTMEDANSIAAQLLRYTAPSTSRSHPTTNRNTAAKAPGHSNPLLPASYQPGCFHHRIHHHRDQQGRPSAADIAP